MIGLSVEHIRIINLLDSMDASINLKRTDLLHGHLVNLKSYLSKIDFILPKLLKGRVEKTIGSAHAVLRQALKTRKGTTKDQFAFKFFVDKGWL